MQGVKEVFWSNVEWHRVNKQVTWTELVGGNTNRAKDKTANITLEKVQKIAETLGYKRLRYFI